MRSTDGGSGAAGFLQRPRQSSGHPSSNHPGEISVISALELDPEVLRQRPHRHLLFDRRPNTKSPELDRSDNVLLNCPRARHVAVQTCLEVVGRR